MAIKSKIIIIDLNKKCELIWKKKREKLYQVSTLISLVIFFFCVGVVILDASNQNYNPLLVGTLFVSVFLSLGCGISLWYMYMEKKWSNLSYEDLKTIMKKLLKRQQIIVIIYIIISYSCLLSTNGDFTSYYSDLYLYRMSYIGNILLFVLPVSLEVMFLLQYHKRINETKEALSLLKDICLEIEKGKLDIINPFSEDSEFYCYGKAFEDIGNATALAVDRRVKSEKMKVDLITNVSHDLKTPLTSIISFIDLIKKESLNDEVKDYLEILTDKANMLKDMIKSLFELSKTTSGNADLKIESMEMNRLVEQILANMDDTIRTYQRVIKVELSQEPTFFQADSKAMYRVFQNLFENALKYSLDGTRIYIKTFIEEHKVHVRIINTAAYEMNFTKEDIVERFTRGDEARTSEGNGLGLAIAKTYVEACQGEFSVEIEGDQFKVDICFLLNEYLI